MSVRKIFACHGRNGWKPLPKPRDPAASSMGRTGNSQIPITPSLAGQPRVFIENQLVLIREGLRDMPPMKGLLDDKADAELVALARYFSAQKPVAAAGTGSRDTYRRGEALARARLAGPVPPAEGLGRVGARGCRIVRLVPARNRARQARGSLVVQMGNDAGGSVAGTGCAFAGEVFRRDLRSVIERLGHN